MLREKNNANSEIPSSEIFPGPRGIPTEPDTLKWRSRTDECEIQIWYYSGDLQPTII